MTCTPHIVSYILKVNEWDIPKEKPRDDFRDLLYKKLKSVNADYLARHTLQIVYDEHAGYQENEMNGLTSKFVSQMSSTFFELLR